MIKIIYFSISLLLATTLLGQNFEGKITFKNTFKSKTQNITDEQFTAMMGDTHEYFIKGGDYKTITNGSFLQWQQYINADNKLYNKMANSETILWNDGSVNMDEVIKAEINKGVTVVMGYNCDEIILTCKSGIQKYYYTSKIAVDVDLFEKHKYGNWFEFISRSKSLPLKMIIENAQLSYEAVAIEVKPMQLGKTMFVLPANAETAKSPY
jgi:hypothetical protein